MTEWRYESVVLKKVVIEAHSGFASGERNEDGVVQLRMNNVTTDGNLDWSSLIRVPATVKQIRRYQLRPGDILFNSTNSPELVGKTTIFDKFQEPVLFSNHFVRLRVDESQIEPRYLARWFVLQWQRKVFNRLSTQWVNQAAVRKGDLLSLTIPLPPLPEQQHIAQILDRVDRLRRLRRYALELSNSYLQSVFLEMFGDPAKNPMKWERATLADVIISAKDGPHVSPNYSDSGIPFLSTRNIRRGEVVWDDLKYITLEEAKKHWNRSGCKPERGDILYTKGGTTGIAKVVDFDQQVAVWVHIAVLKPQHDKVNSTWLEIMLNTDYCYHQSQEFTFGIVNRDLGLRRMPRIKLYIPPRSLQDKFSATVQRYKRLRSQQREALRQTEDLFQSLLNWAFKSVY